MFPLFHTAIILPARELVFPTSLAVYSKNAPSYELVLKEHIDSVVVDPIVLLITAVVYND